MHGLPLGQYSLRYAPFAIVPIAYFYYTLHYRPSRISHDADIARENCVDQVRAFVRCKDEDIRKCENQMMHLHDCIYRYKGWNQLDIDHL